jgi:histidinol-phosphatase
MMRLHYDLSGMAERSTAYEDDLALALRIVGIASEVALHFLRRDVSPYRKLDGSLQTEADVEVERQILDLLAKERPDDALLGEEFGARGISSRRWIVDPIAGTSNFVEGKAEWGPQVALEDGGQIVVGVISRPLLHRRWWASRGGGAHAGDSSSSSPSAHIHVSRIAILAESRVSMWTPEPDGGVDRVKRGAIWVEPDLDDILKLAEGKLEAIIDPTGKPWDHGPAVILVEEAGGRFSDGRGGRRIDLGEGRYTNGLVDEQLDRLLAG